MAPLQLFSNFCQLTVIQLGDVLLLMTPLFSHPTAKENLLPYLPNFERPFFSSSFLHTTSSESIK